MSWIASLSEISGVYLIFENNFDSKQIKDPIYLKNALLFIYYLKMNDLEVHVGYTNTEALVYSIADPDSITIGSYENLRRFKIGRFKEAIDQYPPNARIYSYNLLQWKDLCMAFIIYCVI